MKRHSFGLFFTSGDLKAVLTVHHAFVDPHAVPSFHMTQSAVTHLTLAETQTNSHTREEIHAEQSAAQLLTTSCCSVVEYKYISSSTALSKYNSEVIVEEGRRIFYSTII